MTVVFWPHRRIKENHTKLLRDDEITRGNYSQIVQEKKLYYLCSFSVHLLIVERQTETERGVCVCVREREMNGVPRVPAQPWFRGPIHLLQEIQLSFLEQERL